MVHRCCISSCGMNVRVAEAKGLSYHGFPNREPLREQWIQAIIPHLDKPESFKVVPKYTRVCSRHFRKKDYSVDIKKRARLNSNAVPSVFPRKNSPLNIPNVLGSPGGKIRLKTEPSSAEKPGSPNPKIQKTQESQQSSSLPREYFLAEGPLGDEELTLTLLKDPESSSSLSQEDLSLQTNSTGLGGEDSQCRRKRRKWNRSAYDRAPKGKKKLSSSSTHSTGSADIDGVGEALAEISLSTLLAISTTTTPESDETTTTTLGVNSIEQELLQSIQAVSLHCGEETISIKSSAPKPIPIPLPTPAFLHNHHSSEESIFSQTEDEGGGALRQIMLGGPSLLEIENLADHFNSSLLYGLEDLQVPSSTPSTTSSSTEDIHRLFVHEQGSCPEKAAKSRSSSSSRKKKAAAAPDERANKKHKKEKMCGRFSIERFVESDKDIEYYTGFSSYKNFEAFFRSLEAYVERLRVTDVMFGVTNLDKLQSEMEGKPMGNEGKDSEFISPLPPPPAFDEPMKKRPFHGRSMSRLDELFMTVIRLKRTLPEKVLGHMFCISQPTVSRIIRAWTVLLSKLIDCYPAEGSGGSGPETSEHSYTSRGLGIPDSFRQLFHSELAQSIVSTSVSAKDKKTKSAATATAPKRPKKIHLGLDQLLGENSNTGSSTEDPLTSSVSEVCDLLDPLFIPCGEGLEGSDFFAPVNFLD